MENLKNKNLFLKDKHIVLALSGGIDSVVLLHYLHQHYANNLRVIYCNHHLSQHCGEWHKFCKNLCSSLNIDYVNIDIPIKNKSNIEENARQKRYYVLASNLMPGEVLCTAHHQNDQAETLLLQLFRGSGIAGLAAMPLLKPLGKGVHYRPLLGVEKSSIVAYAQAHKLRWIEDDSNIDTNFRRNFLRLEIMPKLETVYTNLVKMLARSAKHQSESLQLMQDLALIDIKNHTLINNNRLNVSRLIKLEAHRIKNIIKYHLSMLGLLAPSAKIMCQIIDLLSAKKDANPLVSWGQYQIRRYKDELYFIDKQTNLQQPFCPFYVELQQLPNFSIRYRREGQQVKLAGKNHSQSLKKVLQEAGIPPWQRNTLRMYYIDNELRAMECIGRMTQAE